MSLQNTKIAVTGASGHVGFNVASQLLEKGYEIHLLIRRENINVFKLRQKGAIIHKVNLFEPDTYLEILKKIDGVFHIAAENTTSKSNSDKTLKNTAGLTEVFLKSCVTAKVPKIVYTSSVVVLGRSNKKTHLLKEGDRTQFLESPYVEGKLKAEDFVSDLISKENIDIRRVYPAWIVGPGDPRMTPPHKIITDYVQKGMPLYFEGGISIAAVESIAEGHINAFEKGQPKGQYVLGGENITFKDFYNLLSKNTGHSKPILKIPKWMIVLGATVTKPVFKLFGMQPIIEPSYAKSVFGNYSWYDSQKAVKEIDYKIIPIETIIKNAVLDARKRISATTNLGIKRIETLPNISNEGTLLITGVPGWLGNRMIDVMINGDKFGNFQSNRKVKLLVQPHFNGFLNLPDNFEIVFGDLGDKKSLNKALEGVQTVFHIAGAIYPKRISTLYEVNYKGTVNLVDACIEKGVKRILYASTDSVAGKGSRKKRVFDENTEAKPYKNYGKSKYLAEKYILDKTKEGLINGTALRAFWFFGPFAPPRNLNFVKMMDAPRQLVFGNGKNLRSISHVDNTIQAFFKAENEQKTYGKWYWVCGNDNNLTVDDIYKTITNNLGLEYKPIYIPVWVCRFFGMADKFLAWFDMLNPSIHAAGKFYFDIAGNCEAAKKDFGYDPQVSFNDAANELKELI